jgi:hypothetical protein
MALGWLRLAALLVSVSLIVGACSSSSGAGPARSTIVASPAPSSTTAASGWPVQDYLGAVNRLCEALLPKVIAVTHGGSLDVPVNDYLAQQPAHAKLLADFDEQLALVPVPPAAKAQAAALAAYIRFANRLDAKRLAAAKRGAAAYAKEIKSEAAIESDPAITARNAAGFGPSCDAR